MYVTYFDKKIKTNNILILISKRATENLSIIYTISNNMKKYEVKTVELPLETGTEFVDPS